MKLRSAAVLTVFTLVAGLSWAGGRRVSNPLAASDAPSPTPDPSPHGHREKVISKLEQRQMTIGEMVEYFSTLKPGTALRLTYSNGSEFAGNFEGREPGRALIYCRKGLGTRRQVPLRKVMDAYVIVTATHTLRVHQKDFPWKN